MFGDRDLQCYSIAELKRLRPLIKRKRVELRKANDGLEVHPAVLMRAVDEADEELVRDRKCLHMQRK